MTPVLVAVVGLWLIRVAVEVRRWYWERRLARALVALRSERTWEPPAHVRLRPSPFDQDRSQPEP